MSRELRERAAKMLLDGGTLLAEKCPYCGGVRVLKDGSALCVGCGKEPEKKEIPDNGQVPLDEVLKKKLEGLTAELEGEPDHEKQQKILKSINMLLDTIGRTGQ